MIGKLIPDLPRTAWMVLLGDAFSALGGGLVLPFLIVYLHRVRGIDLDVAALAVSTVALVGFVAGPIGGLMVDRFGSRNTLLAGLVAAMAGTVLIALIRQPWHAFLACGVLGTGHALFWPGIQTLLMQVVRPDQRSAVFSVHYAALNLGLGLGGVTGGLIANIDSPRSFELMYAIDASTFLVFIVMLLVMRLPERPLHEDDEARSPGSYREVFADKVFVKVWLLMIVMVVVGYSQLESGFPAYVTGPGGVGTRALGFAFAANTFMIVFAQLIVLKKLEGHRRTRAIAGLCILWSIAWMITLLGGQAGGGLVAAGAFFLAMAIFGLGETILSPTVPALINDLAPDRLRGRYNGLYSLSWSVGHVLGPAAAGFMIDRGNGDAWFVILMIAALGTAAAALRLERQLPASANLIVPAEREADTVAPVPGEPLPKAIS